MSSLQSITELLANAHALSILLALMLAGLMVQEIVRGFKDKTQMHAAFAVGFGFTALLIWLGVSGTLAAYERQPAYLTATMSTKLPHIATSYLYITGLAFAAGLALALAEHYRSKDEIREYIGYAIMSLAVAVEGELWMFGHSHILGAIILLVGWALTAFVAIVSFNTLVLTGRRTARSTTYPRSCSGPLPYQGSGSGPTY